MNKTKTSEIWKDIPGYEDHYQVSSFGRIRSKDRYIRYKNRNKVFYKSKIIKGTIKKEGYHSICLRVDNKAKTFYAHRLVASEFCEKPDLLKTEVNHIDGVKLNNKASNLEWITRSENLLHSLNTGIRVPVRGSKTSNSKLTEGDVRHIRDEYDKLTQKSKYGVRIKLAKGYGISVSNLDDIISRKIWKHV